MKKAFLTGAVAALFTVCAAAPAFAADDGDVPSYMRSVNRAKATNPDYQKPDSNAGYMDSVKRAEKNKG